MNRTRLLRAGIAASVLLAAAPLLAPARARAGGEALATSAVGPHDRAPASGATVARTSQELAALVADPHGPAEIELAPGVFGGDLVVKRPVAIRGSKGTILEGSGRSTVVLVEADDVTLENVVVRGSGRRHTAEDSGVKVTGKRNVVRDVRVEETLFGVSLQACTHCLVERVQVRGWGDDAELRGDGIKLWESHDSVVRGAVVDHSRDVVVWYTKRALLEDDLVLGGRYGAHFMHAEDGAVRRCRFENDVVGIFVMYSARLELEDNVLVGARGAAGVGLGFKDSDAIRVRRNWVVANTTGTYLDNTPRTADQPVIFEQNLFALDDVGMRVQGNALGVELRGNDFHQNATLIEVDGGGDALGVQARGNRFSDYEGYDLDGDGTGDVAYEVKALASELAIERPALKLFAGTAAMALVDTVARAVPLLSSKKLFVDPAPLARRPALPLPRTP